MEMDHLIGQRFNLISKSEIRYVGTLHEINPEQSTIALEDVYSFGTEGRPADNFIAASNQKFDYIVFRGSDVKDIKIAEEQKENKQPEQNVPNDPAILNASRPSQPSPQGPLRNQPPFPPSNFQAQQPPRFQNFYPQYGRGYGPPPGAFPPGPGFGPNYDAMPYYGPPPPGYHAGAGKPFIPNHGPYAPPPQMPIGPPGQRPPSGPRHLSQQGLQAPKELPVNDRAHENAVIRSTTPVSTVSPAPGLTPPNERKRSIYEAATPIPRPIVLAPPATAPAPSATAPAPPASASAPPALASTTKALPDPKSGRVVPALPMTVNNRSTAPIIPPADGALASALGNAIPTGPKTAPPTQIAMEEANRQARAAVANAMAKMNTNAQAANAQPKAVGGNAVEALARKVGEMQTSDPRGGRGGTRGARGNLRGGPNHGRRIEIPKSDYDFESANAKFNKEDMIKEATGSASPIGEPGEDLVNGSRDSATNGEKRKDSLPAVSTEAYNKSSSFFDNISSEAKDREEGGHQQMGRVWRGEEIKKNLETFGQGSVDGGFRGRGRGGFRGRGRGFGGQRGRGGVQRGGGGGGGGGRGGGRGSGGEVTQATQTQV